NECKRKETTMKKSVLIVLSIIGSALALPLLASGPHGTQAGWPIDDSGNILITDAVADRMAQSGAGWIRLHFRLGPYTSDTAQFYSTYDTIVNRLRSRFTIVSRSEEHTSELQSR